LFSGNSTIVNQLYAYLNVSDNVRLTLGNFNTFLGYEVISPTANFNYSTSYMFSYGPFSHTGLKADFSLNGGWSIMLGVFNATDATEFQPEGADYFGGAQLGYEWDNGGAWVNALITDGFVQFDFTGGLNLTDALYLGLFNDDAGVAIAPDESVVAFTLSANYSVGNLTIIPEFRIDSASIDVFDGGTSGSLGSFLVAAVYGF